MAKTAARVELSQTFYGLDQTIDTADYAGISLEGSLRPCKDIDPSDVTKLRSDNTRKARLMRNVSGITAYAGMAVSGYAGLENKRFDGFTEVTAARSVGVIVDLLHSSGCRHGDMCWVIYKGPNLCFTANTEGDEYSIGDIIYAQTAASSTANTVGGTTADDGGKVAGWPAVLTFTADQTTDGTMGSVLTNRLGRALSASTTAETNTLKLVDLNVEV